MTLAVALVARRSPVVLGWYPVRQYDTLAMVPVWATLLRTLKAHGSLLRCWWCQLVADFCDDAALVRPCPARRT